MHGLRRDCVANFDNITPLPKRTLVERVGRMSRAEMQHACAAARFSIGC